MHIIATIGPKSSDKWIIKDFMKNGVDILRLNCSHFKEKEFNETIEIVKELKSDIHIMADLCGRKIRVSNLLGYICKLYIGEEVLFCGEDFYSKIDIKSAKRLKLIPLTISTDILKSNNIRELSIKDGTMNFKLLDKDKGIIKAIVERGGIIRPGKGCNIPQLDRSEISVEDIDKRYIDWALEKEVDIICESYVEEESDISTLRKYIANSNLLKKEPKIWGKVETPQGIKNFNTFVNSLDAVIIGRGDLVPECGMLRAVIGEMEIIKRANIENRAVIIATHVLNSMKYGNSPTLPEVESIYNFIKLNVGGFLLAGETSTGKAPLQSVEFLNKVIRFYEGRLWNEQK